MRASVRDAVFCNSGSRQLFWSISEQFPKYKILKARSTDVQCLFLVASDAHQDSICNIVPKMYWREYIKTENENHMVQCMKHMLVWIWIGANVHSCSPLVFRHATVVLPRRHCWRQRDCSGSVRTPRTTQINHNVSVVHLQRRISSVRIWKTFSEPSSVRYIPVHTRKPQASRVNLVSRLTGW